jgi:hypothetical protein
MSCNLPMQKADIYLMISTTDIVFVLCFVYFVKKQSVNNWKFYRLKCIIFYGTTSTIKLMVMVVIWQSTVISLWLGHSCRLIPIVSLQRFIFYFIHADPYLLI